MVRDTGIAGIGTSGGDVLAGVSPSPLPLAPPSALAITTTQLTKSFGNRVVVDGIDLRIPANQLTALLGPNGSGKTTTMAMLLGLVRPTSGQVEILGQPHGRLDPARVGAMINGPAFYPNLTGRRNLQVLAVLGGVPESRVGLVLDQVGLADAAGRRVGGYSLGMRQRLGLAAALLTDPELLVLDEPSNGLDPLAARELRTLLRARVAAGGTAIVSTHLLNDIDDTCDHVVVMDRGRILFQGSRSAFGTGGEAHQGQILMATEPHAMTALNELLTSRGFRTVIDGRLIRIDAAAEDCGRLNRDAVMAGFLVTELRVERPSVETLFHALVRSEATP